MGAIEVDAQAWCDRREPSHRATRHGRSMLWLLIALLFDAVCFVVICIANAISQRTNPNLGRPIEDRVVLPDVLMEWTRDSYVQLGLSPRLGDFFILSTVALAAVRVLTLRSQAIEAVRRCVWVVGFAYLVRAVLQTSTVLPAPWLACPEYVQRSLFEDALRLFLGQQTSCGDVLPSGHAIIFTSLALTCLRYTEPTSVASVLGTSLVIAHTLLGCLVLVASSWCVVGPSELIDRRRHYTVDVQVACLLVAGIWHVLHSGFRHGSRADATMFERFCARLDGQLCPSSHHDYVLLSDAC